MDAENVTARRLEALLPWLNGDAIGRSEVVACVLRLLTSAMFDTPEAGDLLGWHNLTGRAVSDRQLASLRKELLRVLDETEEPGDRAASVRGLPSLRFGIHRARARPVKLPTEAARRAAVKGGGAFRVTVIGTLRDIVLYAFLRTLTDPGAVYLARCPAPAPGDWSKACGKWLVARGGKRRGRSREFCSDRCRVRAHRVKEANTTKMGS